MFYRLERNIDPCRGLGYTAYTKYLAESRNLYACLDWDRKVGNPLQYLECPIAWRLMGNGKPSPATFMHSRPHHFRDPMLREKAIEYVNNKESQNLIFGVDSFEKLNVWFPKPIRDIMINEFGFVIKRYIARKVWHGLRQSMLDSRTVVRCYDIMDR